MSVKILAATNNKGKLREIREILADFEIVSLKDANITADPEENGSTFAENAKIKATEIAKLTNLPVLADDSGLCVDPLNGEPGIFSARYAGENATDAQRIAKLTGALQHLPEESRTARFMCAVCLIFPDRTEISAEAASCEGYILNTPRGENGFGYDPVFCCRDSKKTFAELSADEKNAISHRRGALQALLKKLQQCK